MEWNKNVLAIEEVYTESKTAAITGIPIVCLFLPSLLFLFSSIHTNGQ